MAGWRVDGICGRDVQCSANMHSMPYGPSLSYSRWDPSDWFWLRYKLGTDISEQKKLGADRQTQPLSYSSKGHLKVRFSRQCTFIRLYEYVNLLSHWDFGVCVLCLLVLVTLTTAGAYGNRITSFSKEMRNWHSGGKILAGDNLRRWQRILEQHLLQNWVRGKQLTNKLALPDFR